jgi:2-desacetyl-2-hydroxyethyl bacteriochlorophyllide A dehydrogenase
MVKARRIAFTAKRQAEWREVELPDQPGPSEVLVRTLWSAVSAGTETAIYAGTHIGFQTPGATYPKYPYLAGYAATGTVLAVGAEAQGIQPGQVVGYSGKHATHSLLDVRREPVVPLPPDTPEDLGALARLVTISLNGVRLARLSLGDSILVFGAGLIGQLAAQLSQLSGGRPVTVVDRLSGRLEVARECGILSTIDASERDAVAAAKEATGGRGFDVAIEATGAAPVVAQALQTVARFGRVVLLGSPRGRVEIDPYHWIHSPGVTVIGAHAMTTPATEGFFSRWTLKANFELALGLLADGTLRLEPLVTHRRPASEAVQVYERIVTNPEDQLGVLLDWRHE